MREPEERNRFGLTPSLLVAVRTGEPAEPYQSGFLEMQLQFEFLHPLSQLREETPGFRFLLEIDDSIIRQTDDDDIASSMALAQLADVDRIIDLNTGVNLTVLWQRWKLSARSGKSPRSCMPSIRGVCGWSPHTCEMLV